MRALPAILALAGCATEAPTAPEGCEAIRVDCPNEPRETLIARCTATSSRCASAHRALFSCEQSHQVCDGRGRLDQRATTAQCATAFEAWERCTGAGADAQPSDAEVDTTVVDVPRDERFDADDGADDTREDTRGDTRDTGT